MKTYFSHSTSETEAIGTLLGEALKRASVRHAFIALRGEMGVGKTAFTRGLAAAFSIDAVRSPTYTVVNEYRGPDISLFHFDLYRLEDEDDLYSIGFDDYMAREGIVLCEWTEKIPSVVPSDAIILLIERDPLEDNSRKITLTIPSAFNITL